MNVLSCGIRMWARVSFVLSQCTRLTDRVRDGQTDEQKGLDNTVRCIICSRTVKMYQLYKNSFTNLGGVKIA